MTSITITVAIPPRILSPNSRGHWAKKAKATKATRSAAFWAAKEVLEGPPPGWMKAACRVHAFFPDARRRDSDNLLATCKAVFDGIADAGIIVNDSALWNDRPVFNIDRKNPRLEITITQESN